jgi:hypothetical protein
VRRSLALGDWEVVVRAPAALEPALLATDPWCWTSARPGAGELALEEHIATEPDRAPSVEWNGDTLVFGSQHGELVFGPGGVPVGRVRAAPGRTWWTLLAALVEFLPAGGMVALRGALRITHGGGHLVLGDGSVCLVGLGEDGWWTALAPPVAAPIRTAVPLACIWLPVDLPAGARAEPRPASTALGDVLTSGVRACAEGPLQHRRFELLADLIEAVPAAAVAPGELADDGGTADRLDALARAVTARRALSQRRVAFGSRQVVSPLLTPDAVEPRTARRSGSRRVSRAN